MRNTKDRTGLAPVDARFLQLIEEYDWAVTKVAPRVDEEGGFFAYSTGLYYRFRHPEIILFGLALDVMQKLINGIGGQVRSGKTFHVGVPYSNVFAEDYRCQFQPVEQVYYGKYLGRSVWFYESLKFPTLQCFWSDKAGLFPWEQGCGSDTRAAQPELFRPAYGDA